MHITPVSKGQEWQVNWVGGLHVRVVPSVGKMAVEELGRKWATPGSLGSCLYCTFVLYSDCLEARMRKLPFLGTQGPVSPDKSWSDRNCWAVSLLSSGMLSLNRPKEADLPRQNLQNARETEGRATWKLQAITQTCVPVGLLFWPGSRAYFRFWALFQAHHVYYLTWSSSLGGWGYSKPHSFCKQGYKGNLKLLPSPMAPLLIWTQNPAA